jgi:hypothetical protein
VRLRQILTSLEKIDSPFDHEKGVLKSPFIGQSLTLESLPNEMILVIFDHMDPIRAVCLSLTCWRFKKIYAMEFGLSKVPFTTFIDSGENGGPARLSLLLEKWMPENLIWNGRKFLSEESTREKEANMVKLADRERKRAHNRRSALWTRMHSKLG